MAISYVQGNTNFSATSTATLAASFPGNTTLGNFIAVCAHNYFVAGTVTGVTDSNGNTYTQAVAVTQGTTQPCAIWYAKNITGGTTPTITVTWSASVRPCVEIREYSGIDKVSPLDITFADSASSALVAQTVGPSATTTQANELVLASLGTSGLITATAGTGYGNLQSSLNTTANRGFTEDAIVSVTGAQTATWTLNTGDNCRKVIATFKAASPNPFMSGISSATGISSITF